MFCVCGWGSQPPSVLHLPLSVCSVLTLARQGHGSQWSDHQLCLFSPAALRDRCKCSTNLDTLAQTSPAALHLFITPLPLLCLCLPSRPLQDSLHYSCLLFFFFFFLSSPPTHPSVLLEMWIKVTAGATEMTESACLQGHLSPHPPFDFSCPPPHHTSPVSACSCSYIAHYPRPRLNSRTLEKYLQYLPHTHVSQKDKTTAMIICVSL